MISKALECRRAGESVFSAVQATWNLFEPSAGTALEEASEQGWRVIVKEGVANGRLTDRNQDPDFVPKRSQLQLLADQFEVSIDAVALAVIIAQSWSNVVLSGAATGEHLLSNLRSVDLAAKLDAGIVNELQTGMAEAPADYWTKRSALSWN